MPLTFADEADYDMMDARDEVATRGLYDVLSSGGQGEVVLVVTKFGSGEKLEIPVTHTLSRDQCGFVMAGSALNLLSKRGRT